MARYDAGETLASIARTYDCSPPAISYVVSRSRGRRSGAAPPPAAAPSEPQLVKSPPPGRGPVLQRQAATAGEPANSGNSSQFVSKDVSAQEAFRTSPQAGDLRAGPELRPVGRFADGHADERRPPASAATVPNHSNHANGLGDDAGAARRGAAPMARPNPLNGSGAAPAGDPRGGYQPGGRDTGGARPTAMPQNDRFVPRPAPGPFRAADEAGNARPPQAPPARGDSGATQSSGDGTFIDEVLRERVNGDIAAFLAAFDAALTRDTAESRAGLRAATDRLLRAGARTRIELERLEARVPLTPREAAASPAPFSRYR